jgi:surfeit locus 1 family protein
MLKRWIIPTFLAIAAVIVLARLGFWQLERLDERRAFNARVLAQVNAVPLDLNQGIPPDVAEMEYRTVTLRGVYDFANQVALRNQDYHLNLGAHLLTPLRLADSDQVILVDRGWIPQADFLAADWAKFDQPGEITLQGVIRLAQAAPDFGQAADPTPAPGDPPLTAWRLANIPAIAGQLPYPSLSSVYIQQKPAVAGVQPVKNITAPLAEAALPDLSEGNHQSYALQWFSFAAVLAIGYPFYVWRTAQKAPGQVK